MDWVTLRGEMQHSHADSPQIAHKCEAALRQLEEALGALAAHGHFFHLEEGLNGAGHPRPWPRWYYKMGQPRRLVGSEWELQEMGFGWFDTPYDSQLAEGYEYQFAAKGGVRRHNLPSALPQVATSGDAYAEVRAAAREQFLRAQRARGVHWEPLKKES
jgi:hypothetical protein